MSKTPAARRARKNQHNRPADFPLSIHKASGQYCKKVRGKVRYFGRVDADPTGEAALALWNLEKDDLLAGREPKPKPLDSGTLVVGELCNLFLAQKESLRDNDELSPRTWADYLGTCAEVVDVFGRNRLVSDLAAADFRDLREKLAKPAKDRKRGLVALGCHIQRVKSLFKFAYDEGLIDSPVRYGQGFQRPAQHKIDSEREKHRATHGLMMFEPYEIRAMLEQLKDTPGMRAMVLLAANCGFGQSDLSRLTLKAVNLETGWIDFGRQKTGVPRRIPLWPETCAAIRAWLPVRPAAKSPDDAGLLFLTCRGVPFVRLNDKGRHIDGIGQAFVKMTTALDLRRDRRGIYALRHVLETIGGELGDQVAVDAVMGHRDRSMAANYRERIGDDRLRRVVDHVRAWLFEGAETPDDGEKIKPGILRTERTCVPSPENPGENVENGNTQKSASVRKTDSEYARTQSPQNSAPALRIFREEPA